MFITLVLGDNTLALTTRGTPHIPDATTPVPTLNESVYLWLPLIVVLVFTGVMLTFVLLSRGPKTNLSHHTALREGGTTRINVYVLKGGVR